MNYLKNIFFIFLFFRSLSLFAQQPKETQHALLSREVSGIVNDSIGQPLVGVKVILKSEKDSTITISDADGIFIFNNVKSSAFLLTLSSIGYKTIISKYLNNESSKKIVLPPLVLRGESIQLKDVTVNGTPSIVYKQDTVEYRASDYKVAADATVDALLKKMEGMEVGKDGALYHQGQQVVKAKLNGKTFSGGDVAQAIQNLPASIVEKIQIVDDYGDQAARTGIKDGDPQKVINITTKADKSIGTILKGSGKYGSTDRYDGQLFAERLDANRQIGVIGNIKSVVNGIATSPITSNSTGISPPSLYNQSGNFDSNPGVTKFKSPSFNYRDNWGGKVEVISSYTYKSTKNDYTTNNFGENNSSRGQSNFSNNGSGNSISNEHAMNFELDYNIDKLNYLQVVSSLGSKVANNLDTSKLNNLNYFTSGFEHQSILKNLVTKNKSITPSVAVLYVHTFKKSKRNFSAQVTFSNSNTHVTGDNNINYRYYIDSTDNFPIRDSLSHLIVKRKNINSTYQALATYVEPLTQNSFLEFTNQLNISNNWNTAISDTVLANGQLEQLSRLDNVYRYSFIEDRLTLDYRLSLNRTNLSLGAAIIPSTLTGVKKDDNTANNVSTSRSGLKIIPILRYSYAWSKVERVSIAYSGINREPDFQFIQPFVDRTDPNNIIIGNPNLKPTFLHTLKATYNRYFPNQKFNMSFGFNAKLYQNQVTTNIVQSTVPVGPNVTKTINEINYVNIGADKSLAANYAISKQLSDRTYSFNLNGAVSYSATNAMSNNVAYRTNEWKFSERLGPKFNPSEQIEINPYINYEVDWSETNLFKAPSTKVQTMRLALDDKFYIGSRLQIHSDMSKNFISGIENYLNNPFVINLGLEQKLLRKGNLVFTLDMFDLLHQNNFVQQRITPLGTTYTLSNVNSRYILIGLKMNLQHWGGIPSRNGQPMKRRGDGSFFN